MDWKIGNFIVQQKVWIKKNLKNKLKKNTFTREPNPANYEIYEDLFYTIYSIKMGNMSRTELEIMIIIAFLSFVHSIEILAHFFSLEKLSTLSL